MQLIIKKYKLTQSQKLGYAKPALAKKASVGFGDPHKQKAHPRQPFGAFFMPEIQVMAVCVGNSSELPGSFCLGSPTPRASSPVFGESRGDVYSTLQKETTMSKHAQVAPATLSILDTDIRCIDGLYSLNDLHKASGGAAKHKPAFFLRNAQTKALIAEINRENSRVANLQLATETVHGDNGGTYACREIVVAYGAWISPTVHLAVIRAFLATVTPSPYITDEQLVHIKQGVREMVYRTGKHWQAVYHELFAYVQAPSVREIKKEHYSDACRFLNISERTRGLTERDLQPIDSLPPTRTSSDGERSLTSHPFDMLADGRYELNIKGKDVTVKDISQMPAMTDHIAHIGFDLSENAEYKVFVRDGKAKRLRVIYGSYSEDAHQPWSIQ